MFTDPAVTRRLTAPFAVLFSPLVVVPVVLAFGAIAGWVLFDQGLAAATAQAFANPALFLAVVVVTVLSAGFHEFGHAAAARYGGSTPGAMGFGIYLFWPAFYTDVTDSYRLGRAGRVRTDLGGLYFNALVVLLSFGVWWLTGWHAVLLIVATQVLQMIRQLAPLLRFDGYHVLADLTGVPDLYRRIGPVLSGLLPGRWHQPEATALKTWARVVVVGVDPRRRPADGDLDAADGAVAAPAAGDGVAVGAGAGEPGWPRRSATATCWRSSPGCSGSWRSSSRCSASGYVARSGSSAAPWPGSGGAPRGGRCAGPSPACSPRPWWPGSAGRGGRTATPTGRCARGRAARSSTPCRPRAVPRSAPARAGRRDDDLAGRRRPAAHRGPPRAGHGARAARVRRRRPAARTAAADGADLGVPVRPARSRPGTATTRRSR